MSGVVVFLAIALLIVLGSLAGLALVRHFVPPARLAGHTDVAGYIYAVIGVLYAVILAQVVVAAWGEYQDARTAAANEANAVLNLQRLSHEWPAADREAVRAGLMDYALHVVNVEWPDLAQGELPSAIDPSPTDRLWSIYDQIGASTNGSMPTFAASLDQLDALDEARRTRFLLAAFGLPLVMSATLLIGGIVTVGFSYFFAVENRWVHVLLTGSLAVMVSLLLLLEYQLETPFEGIDAIEPNAMQVVIAELER
ncbi:MAG: DUF4239 domain-containing protein [Thermomicrobiales bacterium]|nr:DUF4239 domain-containing protein [Thermomicrobiales bacterium]MCA9877631.1 DUF4239 domain-containing protein [Thermomicrobiales bacterium]